MTYWNDRLHNTRTYRELVDAVTVLKLDCADCTPARMVDHSLDPLTNTAVWEMDRRIGGAVLHDHVGSVFIAYVLKRKDWYVITRTKYCNAPAKALAQLNAYLEHLKKVQQLRPDSLRPVR